jgi:voltage-gated potassium channel Kch
MTPNRIMRAAGVRRALLLVLAIGVAVAALAACGGGGGDTSSAAVEKEADVLAYDHALRGLGGHSLATARLFRVQEQEHVDAILRSLRSLEAEADPPSESIDVDGLKTEAEYLNFLYELESGTIATELTAIAKLTTPSARMMLAATVANQAQHLVLLRRELGAKPAETVPAPFESGTTPAP